MRKIIKFPLHNFFQQVFEEVKRKQNDIQRKKIEFLYKEAYRFFLDTYLMKIAKDRAIDFPAFMYEAGIVICKEAETNAKQTILNVIRDNRVNECYTRRVNELKKFATV